MTMQISRRQTPTRLDEREIVDYLVEHLNAYQRQVVVNYYVALKTKHFVILAGPHDVDKMGLAQGLAEILLGESSLQWCSFQAHPWWATRTGNPGRFAIAHTQFNTLKLLDFVEVASASEAARLHVPFFVGIRQISLAEVECYFNDLPRGLLCLADASTIRVDLPQNVYVTGTMDAKDGQSLVLSQEVRQATVVQVNRDHFVPSAKPRKTSQHSVDWQRRFIGSTIRHIDHAKAKLAQILPDGCVPLAPLVELERFCGAVGLSSSVFEEVWLYLANAFDDDGRGLFVEPVIENLRIAQDYVLAQNVLPYVTYKSSQWAKGIDMWDQVSRYLAPHFPRAHTWIAGLLEHRYVDPPRNTVMIPAIEPGLQTCDEKVMVGSDCQ